MNVNYAWARNQKQEGLIHTCNLAAICRMSTELVGGSRQRYWREVASTIINERIYL